MTAPVDRDRDDLAAALADHRTVATADGHLQCSCDRDWRLPVPHRQHLADALLPVVARIRADAVAEALEGLRRQLHVDPLLRSADYASYVAYKVEDFATAVRAAAAPQPTDRQEQDR
jgi:hypothetical protein